MWDTWGWTSAAISAKVKADSDEKSRQMDWAINEARNAKDLEIARLEADTKRYVAELDATSRANIAEADRLSKEEIAIKDRESRERVAMLQTVGQVAPKLVPVALGGQLITKNKGDGNNKNSGPTTLNTAPAGAQTVSNAKIKSEADKLFPDLEPTFKSTPNSKTIKFGLGAALTGAVVSMMSSLPLLI